MSRRALALIVSSFFVGVGGVSGACGHPQGAPAPIERAAPPAPTIDAPPPPPPPVDAAPPLAGDPRALAAGLVAVYEDLATATGAGDCAAIASAIGPLRAKHADVLDAARKADAAGRGAEVKAALEPYRDRVRAALETISAKTAPCAKDPALEHAIDALFGA